MTGTMEFSRTELAQNEEKKGPLESFVEWITSLVSEPESASGEADTRRFADLSPGYFGMHVGFAPVFSDAVELDGIWNDDGQLKYPGAGEIGR